MMLRTRQDWCLFFAPLVGIVISLVFCPNDWYQYWWSDLEHPWWDPGEAVMWLTWSTSLIATGLGLASIVSILKASEKAASKQLRRLADLTVWWQHTGFLCHAVGLVLSWFTNYAMLSLHSPMGGLLGTLTYVTYLVLFGAAVRSYHRMGAKLAACCVAYDLLIQAAYFPVWFYIWWYSPHFWI